MSDSKLKFPSDYEDRFRVLTALPQTATKTGFLYCDYIITKELAKPHGLFSFIMLKRGEVNQ